MTPLFQRHPHPRLQRSWHLVQLGLFLLPFSTLLGALLVLIAAGGVWRQKFRHLSRQPLTWGWAGLSVGLIVTASFAPDRSNALLGLFNFLPFFAVFPALSELIQTPAQLRRLAWLWVIPSLPVGLIGLAQLWLHWGGRLAWLWDLFSWTIAPQGNPIGRMSSIFTYANVLASYYGIVFVLALGLWLETPYTQRRRWWFLTGVLVLDTIALILTNSRNVWAIALLACLAFAFYEGWRWVVGGCSAVAGVMLGAAFAPPPFQAGLRAIVPRFFWARLNDELYGDRPIAELRSTQWQFAGHLAQQRPWTGWGLRSFTQLYADQTQLWLGHPHNLLLMMAAETGFPATALFYALVGWIVAQGVRQFSRSGGWQSTDRRLYFTFLTAFLGCTLFSFLDITLFDARINLMGWLLLAGIAGVARHSARSLKKEDGKPRLSASSERMD